jgi:rhamnosyltransferase
MPIATAVVLYYPGASTIATITKYLSFVDFLIIVDNTDNQDLAETLGAGPKLCYAPMGTNSGIAAALNVAARIAIDKRFTWMLMLDQDSLMEETTYDAIKHAVGSVVEQSVAIFAPVQVSKLTDHRAMNGADAILTVNQLMTSGSALNLNAFSLCGPFEEKLFIDHVDNEYCFRLTQAGYKVRQLTQVMLDHSLGEVLEARLLFGRSFQYVSHRPFRSYYYVRNGFYVAFKFIFHRPGFLGVLGLQIAKDVLKAIIFEDETALRLKMMLLGFVHFCIGRYGPLRYSR